MVDVTSSFGQLNIQGPRSRELLQSLTTTDLSNDAFPFRTAQEIDLGFARVLCVRITYVGELGYELYIPAEQATHVYDLVVQAGPSYHLRHAGLKALASLRMEKGYRDYGHDIDNTDNPYEAGLGFAIDLSPDRDFLGRQACLELKQQAPWNRRLAQIQLLDPNPMMYHAEIVYRNGQAIGDIRAASYGHTLGGAVGLSMLEAHEPINKSFIQDATWEVDVAGTRYPTKASIRPMYDPTNQRIKG